MNKFKLNLLKNKRISVWGLGYLGYTTTLKLTSAGFTVNLFQFDLDDIENKLVNGTYPSTEQKSLWSKNTEIPKINLSNVSIKKDSKDMFNSNVHIIAMPILGYKENTLNDLLKIFKLNYNVNDDALILFQAAETPGWIQNKFIDVLIQNESNYSFASAFRSDWNIEEFFLDKQTRIIAGHDEKSRKKVSILFELFNIKYLELNSIKESEVYINAKKSLEFTMSAFLNQLSLAYPDININNFSEILLNNIESDAINLGFGSTDFKNANSIDHLLQGVEDESIYTIIKEAQSTNVSLLLYYADLLKRKNVKSVLIFGISSQDSLKDIRFSPSIILAEYLNTLNIKVYINDPNFDELEMKALLPFSHNFNLKENVSEDAVFIMKSYKEYRTLTQNNIEENSLYNTSIIIDNIGLFTDFIFSESTLYHHIGDGNFKRLMS